MCSSEAVENLPAGLYLVSTPIGNLQDITLRALEVLKQADLIACEDTRHTKRLLDHFEIKTRLESFHDHSASSKVKRLVDLIEQGSRVAYVSDAGTPVVADPGFPLVREAIRRGLRVEALPGAFAAVTALAASGLHAESFSFFGFLPPKPGARKNRLKELASREETLIFYESPYRLKDSLAAMSEVLGEREAVVARELTKKFEEFLRGRLSDLAEKFNQNLPRGEFVILVAGCGRKLLFDNVVKKGP